MTTFPKLSVLFCGPDNESPQKVALFGPLDGVKVLGGHLLGKRHSDPPTEQSLIAVADGDGWIVRETGEKYLHFTVLPDDFIRPRWEARVK